MKYPKLRHALLCRVLVYIVVLGGFTVPMILIAVLPFLPAAVKTGAAVLLMVGLVVFIFRNILVLMAMDMMLAVIHERNKARKSYDLSETREGIERRMGRFGCACEPAEIKPKPDIFRYKMRSSLTVYHRGIERMMLSYSCPRLTAQEFRAVMTSAKANVKARHEYKKPFLVDKTQKKEKYNISAAVVIFASELEASFSEIMYEKVCKEQGDGDEIAVLCCIVDLSRREAVFDREKMPFVGFSYSAKSRAINMIERCVFGGKVCVRGNDRTLEPIQGYDLEMSLWSLWADMHKMLVRSDRETKRIMESLTDGEVKVKDGLVYVKSEERGAVLWTEPSEEERSVRVEHASMWSYPKANKMSRNHRLRVMHLVREYYESNGYSVSFEEDEEDYAD